MTGFFIMLAIMLIIAALTGTFTVKSRGSKEKFDERQLIARGKAFEAGFYTLILLLFAYIVGREIIDLSIMDSGIAISLCAIIAVGVFGIVGIIKDGFVGYNVSNRGKKVLFGVLGAANLALGALAFHDGQLLENGRMDESVLNIAVGVMAIAACIGLAVRDARQKKAAALEEADDE